MIYLWDLAGQQLFKKIRTYYMSHALLTVIVIDLSKYSTFNINHWITDLKIFSPKSDFILVGNKSDIVHPKKHADLLSKIKLLENLYKHKIHITSAKSGENIKELFIKIKIKLIQQCISTS